MSSEVAIRVENLGKCYHIYERPQDRLKQSVFPHFQRLVGRPRNYFREFWALKDVSFTVKRGETTGIVGRNGSGKSTLLQMICGTLTPTKGNLETNGRVAALLELGSGFNPEFTGRENVFLNAAVLGMDPEEVKDSFAAIAEFADIGDFIEQPVKSYSSGMVVRLAFSVAIHVNPDILVVDEALSVGDELFQRKCFSRIEALKSRGATILFVSHSGATVVSLCDRSILLDQGELLAVGSPKKVVGQYQKLLYAPADQRLAIRQAIRQSLAGTDDTGAATSWPREPGIKPSTENTEPSPSTEVTLDAYDPYLIPQSTVNYASRGAEIQEPHLVNAAGLRVNIISRGRCYQYTYRVRFDSDFEGVRFGMLIKTTSGVELGGGVSLEHKFFRGNTCVEVSFSFECNLNPGIYYLNSGVMGYIDGNSEILHRLVDGAVFRVVSEAESPATGIVDFHCVANSTVVSF